ncbi:Rft-containing protein [Coleophoma cylindrospora]|uniref:Man(5)GlcNAc(2)-PP-dolichol translocation protein RFT1 n=1 Tax=Coleophoma cylindrospora TaxID=1849047 RepID=A0A3D8QGV9_9HELO|nr:Rft-containing protein [Coleophoma cylindrospora]
MTESKPAVGKPAQNAPAASSSVRGASWLIGLQFGSRALTFVVNQLLLRFMSPELLGIATQLEVYSISVLFFARESLRVALQRQNDGEEVKDKDDETTAAAPQGFVDGRTAAGMSQAIVNLAYVTVFLGAVFATGLGWLYLGTMADDSTMSNTPFLKEALNIYACAAIVELLAEPAFVIVQQKSRYKIRAAAEGFATVLRCVVTCGTTIFASRRGRDIGPLSFALGQGAYSIALLLVYVFAVSKIASTGGFSLFPQRVSPSARVTYLASYLSRPLLSLGASLFAQSTLKHVLTQGDTVLISSLASQRAQGVYALASNYGGLVARLVLQPIEESSRNYFGKTLSSLGGKPSTSAITKASHSLHLLLRLYNIFSIGIIALGPTAAPLALSIVAGPRWASSGAGQVLAVYCYYIPALAINGITEAFVSAVATEAEVNRQSMWMFAFSAGFVGAGYVFLRILDLGAEGLVWANTLNMLFRIVWSSSFVRSYLKRNGGDLSLTSIMPQPFTIALGVGTAAILSQMKPSRQLELTSLAKIGSISVIFCVLL